MISCHKLGRYIPVSLIAQLFDVCLSCGPWTSLCFDKRGDIDVGDSQSVCVKNCYISATYIIQTTQQLQFKGQGYVYRVMYLRTIPTQTSSSLKIPVYQQEVVNIECLAAPFCIYVCMQRVNVHPPKKISIREEEERS